MSDNTRDMLAQYVQHIVDTLEYGTEIDPDDVDSAPDWLREWHESDHDCENPAECYETPSAFDWLADALDIEYFVGGDGEYRGAEVLVGVGGPNLYVNSRRDLVEGHWGGESVRMSYTDSMGLGDALRELWESR